MPVPASSILPTLDELKVFLNIANSVSDDELTDKLDKAAELVARHVGPLDAETVTDEVHDGGSTSLVLKRYPVVEVTAASYWDGTAIDVADLEVNGDAGIIDWGYNTSGGFRFGRRNVRVTYTVGRSVLPGPIHEAILVVAGRLWETQRGNAPSALPVDETGLPTDPGSLPLLPPRARELLEPYLLGPVIA